MDVSEKKIIDKKQFKQKTQPKLTQLVITSYDELKRLSDVWTSLCEESGVFIQSYPDWVLGWWAEFGGGAHRKLQVITYWSSRKLVGVAPFYVGLSVVNGKILQRRLRMIGSGGATNEVFGFSDDYGVSDFLDIVIKPGYEELVSEGLSGWLQSHQNYFDYVQFLHTREDQTLYRICWPVLKNAFPETVELISDHCPFVDLQQTSSIRDFIESLPSKSARRRLRQSRNATIQKREYSTRKIRSEAELTEAFAALILLHQRRWNRAGYPGIFDDERFVRFSEPLILNLFRKNQLRVYVARDPKTDHIIAARIALFDGKRYYDYLTGFDDEHRLSRLRPGIGLMLLMIEDAIADKAITIELLRGEESYKFDFTSEVKRNYYLEVRNPRADEHQMQNHLVNSVSRIEKVLRRERRLIRAHMSQFGLPGLLKYGNHRARSLKRKVSSTTNSERDKIPVLSLSEIGLVHSLGKASIPVISGSFFFDNPALTSARRTGQILFSPYDTTDFIDELIDYGKKNSSQLVLMSDDDRAILNISRHRHLLEPYYLFRLPAVELVNRISNKHAFIEVCNEYKLPAPASFSVESEQDLEQVIPELNYPVIVKPPYKEYWWGEQFERQVGPYKKAYKLENADSLRALYRKIAVVHPSILIQEYVPGPDHHHISVNLFVDKEYAIKGLFAARKHRVYPITAGVGCYVQLMHDPVLNEICVQLIEKLQLTGLVNIQFKQDERTNEYKLIEIQFRNSFWGYIGTAAGINLPSMYYADLMNDPLPEVSNSVEAFKFFDLGKDVKAAYDYIRNGELTFGEWIRSYRGPKTFHGIQWSDPIPVIRQAGFLMQRRVRRVFS